LKNEENKLSDYSFFGSNTLFIEKGKPMRKGEVVIKFFTFSYTKEGYDIADLFKLALPEKMTIKEAKTEIVKHFNELQKKEDTKRKDNFEIGDEDHIRLRELYCRCPHSIFVDSATIKESSRYYSPEIIVQKVPEGEVKTQNNVVLFFQHFFPSKYEVGDVFELATTLEETLDTLRKRITEKTGCKNVVIALSERWEGFKLLNIPTMHTFKPTEQKEKDKSDSDSDSSEDQLRSSQPLYTVRRLAPRDGEIVYFWDNTEPLKTLTEEEKKVIILKERSLKNRKSRSSYDKEESLQIKEKDVEIEDN